ACDQVRFPSSPSSVREPSTACRAMRACALGPRLRLERRSMPTRKARSSLSARLAPFAVENDGLLATWMSAMREGTFSLQKLRMEARLQNALLQWDAQRRADDARKALSSQHNVSPVPLLPWRWRA